MSETNGKASKRKKVNRGPWATVEEANANKPEGVKASLFRVAAPDGSVAFWWVRHADMGLALAAKKAGWSASEVGKAPTKEKVGNLLAQLTPEDRAILIAQYVPTTEKATGKGKK
jgi:hypothetical protein